jgi:hypothetical protein
MDLFTKFQTYNAKKNVIDVDVAFDLKNEAEESNSSDEEETAFIMTNLQNYT